MTEMQSTQSAPRSAQSAALVAAARNGNFRAIAYWLNHPLVPQGIYVQVQAAGPGCVQALVEFHRQPSRNRLMRFICHRLWLLESELIEGVHIVARYIGSSHVLWQQSIRIPTLAERQRRQQAVTQPMKSAEVYPFPPQIGRRRRRRVPQLISPEQMKLARACLLSGSAIAAFVVGVWMEILVSQPSPQLPLLAQTEPAAATPVLDQPERSPLVEAALETVAVIHHEADDPPADGTVTLLFGGEVSPEDINIKAASEPELPLLAELETSQQADLTMVSLGQPLTSAATSLEEEYHQRTRLDSAEALHAAGVEIVNIANEQIADYGEAGVAEAISALDRAGIYRTGAGRNLQEARRPEIIDVEGQRIAYLAYAGEDWTAASATTAGISPQQHEAIAADIKALRSQVDWIVVNYRWGNTLEDEAVADWQVDLARFAIDQGADVVVGQHPKILQGAELYNGRPIAYSLGDFVFEDDVQEMYDTAVLKVSLRPDQMKVDLVPVTVHNAQPHLAQGHRKQQVLARLATASAAFEQPVTESIVIDLKTNQGQDHAPQLENLNEVPPAAPGSLTDPAAPFVDQTDPGEELTIPAEKAAPAEKTLQNFSDREPEPAAPDAVPTSEAADPEAADTDSEADPVEQPRSAVDAAPEAQPDPTVEEANADPSELPDLNPDRPAVGGASVAPAGEREALRVIPPEEEPLIGPLVMNVEDLYTLDAIADPAAAPPQDSPRPAPVADSPQGTPEPANAAPEQTPDPAPTDLVAIAGTPVTSLDPMDPADAPPVAEALTVPSPARTVQLPLTTPRSPEPTQPSAAMPGDQPKPELAIPTPADLEPKPKLDPAAE